MGLVEGARGGGVYGEIYGADLSTAQGSLGTTQAAIDFSTIGASDGISNEVTPNVANDRIDVVHAGNYRVHWEVSFSGTGNAIFKFHLRIGGVEQARAACVREIGTGGDVGNCGFDAMMTLAASDQLTIYVETDNGADTDTMTIEDCHFNIERMDQSG